MKFTRYPDSSSAVIRQQECSHEQLKMAKFFGRPMLGCGKCEMLWEIEDASFVEQKLSEVRETFKQREALGDDSLLMQLDLVGCIQ